jgi:hypothetical protein
MLHELTEVWVVENEPQDDRFVDIKRWKLIRVSLVDDLGDFSEV